ncbi:MAG: hypothetical protein RIC16_14535 [Rhodospirillales bacterium]
MSEQLQQSRNVLAAAAMTVLLAGCASGISTVTSVDMDKSDFFHYRAAASDGTVHVAVAGQAGDVGRERLKTFVAEQFSAVNVPGPAAEFSSDPASMDFGGSRFVVAFHPGPELNVRNMCRTEASALDGLTTAGESSGLYAIAAFCNGDDVRYWAESRASADVTLEAFSRRLARDVIPKPISGKECDRADC